MLKSVNIWQSYKQERGCLMHFARLANTPLKGEESARDNDVFASNFTQFRRYARRETDRHVHRNTPPRSNGSLRISDTESTHVSSDLQAFDCGKMLPQVQSAWCRCSVDTPDCVLIRRVEACVARPSTFLGLPRAPIANRLACLYMYPSDSVDVALTRWSKRHYSCPEQRGEWST